MTYERDLERIATALERAQQTLDSLDGVGEVRRKEGGSPVTVADEAIDATLRQYLPRDGEGWLSEETLDDHSRLKCERVWVVDPLDGTKEYVAGVPEWCISVGLVEHGRAVAGGVLAPRTGELFLGSVADGMTLNGKPVVADARPNLAGGSVLASRSECKSGEWQRFDACAFEVVPMGSVAYKLARVAAGLATATWTLTPKNEWDVAAGTALTLAAGGAVYWPNGESPSFNRANPRIDGLVACSGNVDGEIRALLEIDG